MLDQFRASDRKLSKQALEQLKQATVGKAVQFSAGGIDWKGILDSRSGSAGVFHYGVTLDDDLGRFQLSHREDNRMLAHVFFYGESIALTVPAAVVEDDNWEMQVTSLERVVCAPPDATYGENGASPESDGFLSASQASVKAGGEAPLGQDLDGPVAAPPILNSKPDSTFVLYIDFDGEVVTHPGWNNGNTINAAPDPGANDVDYVTAVWARTAEDYAPFDINVTTDRAVFDAAAVSNRVMCVSTPTNTAAPGAGGVAYLNSFGYDTPCWNFNIYSDYYSADTVSHEVGHTVGLSHDGRSNEEYYGGHGGTGPTSWSPIMGAAWANANDEQVTQWSKGEYPDASNQEDDFTVITSNGFGFEADDKGDTLSNAAELLIIDGAVSDSGIIEKPTDLDWVSFATSGGSVSLNFEPIDVNSPYASQRGSNLALSAELYDSSGSLLVTANDESGLDAYINTTLAAGIYYVRLNGMPRGDLSTGFPEYGSIGQYTISGSIPQSGLISVSPSSAEYAPFTSTGTCYVSTESSWTWSCDADWVTSFESASQAGDQRFDYSISSNPELVPRTAEIVFSIDGYSTTHTIIQQASTGDDHSNVLEGSTLIQPDSITGGVLETEGDLDVFRIQIRKFGDLTVESSGYTNTFGEILSSTGVVLASNDNGLVPNFSITRSLSPGIYYIRVRHALTRGIGAYRVITRLDTTNSMGINPEERSVPAMGGDYGFSVISNTVWQWSSDSAWLTSSEAGEQIFGQRFDYSVAENNGSTRVGHITLTAGTVQIIHTVTQIGIDGDDHGNTNSLATDLALDSSADGEIEAVGDVDVFRVILPTTGDLRMWSTGIMDSRCTLYDATGEVVASNDDLVGLNFGFTEKLTAGTYYAHVRHFSQLGTGDYVIHSEFDAAESVTARYTAGFGGLLSGPPIQTVAVGGNPVVVTAVPVSGQVFMQWSDGHPLAARDDSGLVNDIDVTAEFAYTLAVAVEGGDVLHDNQNPKVDYGDRWINEIAPMNFVITNNGSETLADLQLAASGHHVAQWSLSPLAVSTLLPGESTSFTATLQGTSPGEKTAFFTVTATGTNVAPFRIPVVTNILDFIVVNTPGQSNGAVVAGDETDAPVDRPDLPEGIIGLASDGYYRHAFQVPTEDSPIPGFEFSTDGIEWTVVEPFAVELISADDDGVDYEALFTTLQLWAPYLLISEVPNQPTDP